MTYLPPDSPADVEPPKAKVTPESVLAAPRTPVTRWNRRYLAVGAGALALLVAAGFWIGFGANKRPAGKEPPPPASDTASTDTAITARYAKGYGDPAVAGLAGLGGPGQASLPPPGANSAGSASPASQSTPTPAPDPAVQKAQLEANAARTSNPFFASAGAAPPLAQPAAPPPMAYQGSSPPSALAAAAEPAAPDVLPANGQAAKRQFAVMAAVEDYLGKPLRDPISPWEVKAGTVIPAALLTAINSDLPGEIIAQVTQPVYDHVTGRTVLIPQGSRLIGKYNSQVAYGDKRVLIAWNRIVMPNGRSINIGAMEGADLAGASGLRDQVDRHFGQLAGGIFLSTIFSVGAASAQDASNRSSGNLVVNSSASGISNEAQQVGQQITSRDLNRQPTITVRPGWSLLVLVDKDMVMRPYPY